MKKSDITTIRVQRDLKNKIEVLQRNYNYNFIYEVLEDMSSFFLNNGLSPTTNLNLNIHEEIQNLNQSFKKRDDSFRKWFGEVSYKKLETILKQNEIISGQNQLILDTVLDKTKSEILTELDTSSQIEVKNESENNDLKLSSDVYYKVLDQKEESIKDLKNKLEFILSKAEKTVGNKTFYTIRLNEMEYDTLKNL